MRLEGKMVQPAYDRMMDIFVYATITISGVAIGATILFALYYLKACCMSHYSEKGMSPQHGNNDVDLQPFTDHVSTLEAQHETHRDDDTGEDFMKGVT